MIFWMVERCSDFHGRGGLLMVCRSACLLLVACLGPASASLGHAAKAPIVAHVHPAANAAGWNNAPVTVSFHCVDPLPKTACPGPVVLATEGANQVVTKSAMLPTGQQVWASATVNIDWTPPSVAISSPSDDATTQAGSVRVSASVGDTLSGPALTTCNLVDAPIVEGVVSCGVPLGKGRNALIVQVSDAAGNSASAAMHVFREARVDRISASPSTLTITAHGQSRLDLLDDLGREVRDAQWSSSDPAIADVENEDGHSTVFGRSAGKAQLTATKDGLSTEVTAVVVDTSLLTKDDPFLVQPGATLWSVPGFNSEVVEASPVIAGSPDLFLLDRDGGGRILRSLTDRGVELAREVVPDLEADQTISDLFDGVVLVQTSARSGGTRAAVGTMMRVGGNKTGSWVFTSAHPFCSEVTQALAGVLVVIECEARDDSARSDATFTGHAAWLLRVDALTGRALSRIELPTLKQCSRSLCDESPSIHGSPTSGIDGAVYLLLSTGNIETQDGDASTSSRRSLQLLRVATDGAYTFRELAESRALGGARPREWPTSLVTNGDDRVLGVSLGTAGAPLWVIDEESVTALPMGAGVAIDSIVVDPDQTLVGTRVARPNASAAHMTTAYDAETLAPRWHASGSPVVPADGGAILTEGTDGTLHVINAKGDAVASWVVPRVRFWGADVWLRTEADKLSAVSGPAGERALSTVR
jgi:hypothetical protein